MPASVRMFVSPGRRHELTLSLVDRSSCPGRWLSSPAPRSTLTSVRRCGRLQSTADMPHCLTSPDGGQCFPAVALWPGNGRCGLRRPRQGVPKGAVGDTGTRQAVLDLAERPRRVKESNA